MPWRNVETAIDLLEVDRIDHGYTIVDNPELAAHYATRGLVFTVVPTNSYYMRTLLPDQWAERHPIRRMPALGLKIHLNTMTPRFTSQLQAKLKLMFSHLGFTTEYLKHFMINGIDGAWIDEQTKAQWRKSWPKNRV